MTMYVPSLHILCSKLKKFLTTYPTLSANVICESSLISLAIICFDQERFHSFIDVSHSNFVETEIPTKRQCTDNRQKIKSLFVVAGSIKIGIYDVSRTVAALITAAWS